MSTADSDRAEPRPPVIGRLDPIDGVLVPAVYFTTCVIILLAAAVVVACL